MSAISDKRLVVQSYISGSLSSILSGAASADSGVANAIGDIADKVATLVS